MLKAQYILRLLCTVTVAAALVHAQNPSTTDIRMRLAVSKPIALHPAPSAVIWLEPLQQTPPAQFVPEHRYTLLQKNRMFTPHLLVIPVGSVVLFPNADPFFHNVFSLFDGKRFDLGLYEAGSTKAVTFSREGVSYIFCNIHPEMSAVVLTLSTSHYAIADSHGEFRISDVPEGDYELHVWIEGIAQPALSSMVRRVHLATSSGDLGAIQIPYVHYNSAAHPNMFGQPYDQDVKPTY